MRVRDRTAILGLWDAGGRKTPLIRALTALPNMWDSIPGEVGSHWGILKKFLHHICLQQNKYGYCVEEGLIGGQPERYLSRNLCEKWWHGRSRAMGTNWPGNLCLMRWREEREERKDDVQGSQFNNQIDCGALDLKLARLKVWRTIMNSTLDWICSVWKMSKSKYQVDFDIWVAESVSKYFFRTYWCHGSF